MSNNDLTQNDYRVNIEDIMHTAYLQYSLSVNVGRAIPDVRDGLKPVNRRILYVMRLLNLTHTHAYSKCAKVVGDVMGEYHPHGDSAIYDTLVRMAQDFSMRAPLIDGQGNFGSIDGDPPAAYRYTECRMTRLAEELLTDLDKETVDMIPNYAETTVEPSVLPARFPNLLVNGSTGIGVGMATSIPPHNLGEVIDATVHLIDHPRSTPRDLMTFIKGPDFPTGATLCGVKPLMSLYENGRAVITLRGKATIEEKENGGERIVITELPYMVNKEMLVAKIAELANDKIITGISDLNDYSSSRVGIRIVVDIKRNEMASLVLNQLYKHSNLQESIGCQFLVVDRNRPRTMNLVQILQAYIDHRLEVITRRCRFELKKAEAREHILAGLLIAVDNIDEVVAIIRNASNREEAGERLRARFGLTPRQTQAILEMRLHQLTGLAREELHAEYAQLLKTITHLKELLASRELRMGVVKTELLEVRNQYAEDRRTEIMPLDDDISLEDLIQRAICVIMVSKSGYIKRMALDLFRTQRRGGKGITGASTKDEDPIAHVFTACTHDYIFFFTSRGQMHWLKVYEIPEARRESRGKAIINLVQVEPGEEVRAMLTVDQPDDPNRYLVFATHKGIIKKSPLADYSNLRKVSLRAILLEDGDDLMDVQISDGSSQIMLISASARACRFEESQARSMSRGTYGVIGIRLRDPADQAVALVVTKGAPDEFLLTISELGMGKRSVFGNGVGNDDEGEGDTPSDDAETTQPTGEGDEATAVSAVRGFRLTNRGSQGVIAMKLRKGDRLAGALKVADGDELLLTTSSGRMVRLRISAEEFRVMGRGTFGVRVMDLDDGERIAGLSLIQRLEGDDVVVEESEEGSEDAALGEGDEAATDTDAAAPETETPGDEPPTA
jgi:DNA gyrase subunit A